jgi:hypothetical protein
LFHISHSTPVRVLSLSLSLTISTSLPQNNFHCLIIFICLCSFFSFACCLCHFSFYIILNVAYMFNLKMLQGHSGVGNTPSFPVQQNYEILSSSLSHISIGTPSTKNNYKFYIIFQMNINIFWPCSHSQTFFYHCPQRSNFHVWA